MSWQGGAVRPYARCVLAGNPGPMTLDGTNTWVLRAPGADHALVVDPGPLDEAHLHAVASTAEGARVTRILLTHGHSDHSAGAGRFAELVGAPVLALDPAHRLGDEGLATGDVLTEGELRLEVVHTPGHTADSLCFVVRVGDDPAVLLTGDTVLGRGSTVIAHPDGDLGAYLDSLRTLRALVADGAAVSAVLPGHGPVVDEPLAALEWYLAHREERLEQVRTALAAGARTPEEVVATVYADVDRSLWPFAELSVRAQLAYLGVSDAAG